MRREREPMHLFGTIDAPWPRERIAALYGAASWRVRKCAWTDFEVISDFARLVIEADSPILLHGPVDDVLVHVDEIAAPLRSAGLRFSLECCDSDAERTLLRIVHSEDAPEEGC